MKLTPTAGQSRGYLSPAAESNPGPPARPPWFPGKNLEEHMKITWRNAEWLDRAEGHLRAHLVVLAAIAAALAVFA